MKNIAILVYNDVAWLSHRVAPVELNLNNLRKTYHITDDDLNKLQIFDASGSPVDKVQIDKIDKNDSNKDVLTFMAEVEEDPSLYFLSSSDLVDGKKLNISKEIWNENEWKFKFENNKIMLDFDRGSGFSRYSGSSREVIIKHKMNNISNPFDQKDSEKMMQLESIDIRRFSQDWYFPSQDYEYVTSGQGDLRTFLTIKRPIWIDFKRDFVTNSGIIYDRCNCNLYRVISLFHDKDYILEDIYIESESLENTKDEKVEKSKRIKIFFEFSATFFTRVPGINQYMDVKKDFPEGCPKNMGWFAVGNYKESRPGFGFASNFPLKGEPKIIESDFKWAVSPSYHLKCLHQFMDETNTMVEGRIDFGHVVGANWFNSIYKPLWAQFVEL